MPQPIDPPVAAPLADLLRTAQARGLPPVDAWNPTHCGHSGMRIARDGSWHHEGQPIRREAMVRLFSTILRREPDGSFVLVTPVEKLTIDVEDAPFVAVELRSEGERRDRILAFRLGNGDWVAAREDHPLRIEERPDGPRPYLEVRRGLDALLARSV